VNVLDEVPYSYSHQGHLELDQIRHIAKTWDHESMDLEMIKLLSKVYAFYEEEGMQSWTVLLCLFTLEQVFLSMWNYKMSQQH
jgi:hypothetical protein